MARFISALPLLAFACIALLVVPAVSGQIVGVGADVATPIPGAGHDYIKMLAETVNPGNGSLSVRIQVPTPNGRGISLPFAFAYDSGGVAHVEGDSSGTQWAGNTSYLSRSGWSYSIPMMSNLQIIEGTNGVGAQCTVSLRQGCLT